MPRKPIEQQAEDVAKSLDAGEWPEDLEPQEVAWLLRELARMIILLRSEAT